MCVCMYLCAYIYIINHNIVSFSLLLLPGRELIARGRVRI